MTDIIRGKYSISEELGRGGMGVVYKAQQVNLDRTVAIKMLTPDLAKDEELVRRFRMEAKIIARLDHPNIIRVFDVEECDDTFYIIMEYVHGPTLQKLLAQERRFDEARTIELTIQTAAALQYAHSLGVVHRDIKPDNIMLTARDRVKVMDFGIARLAQADVRTQTGMRMGTPRYMSPEQASGQKIDGRSDVYSLGCVLYGMITGYLPFDGDNPITIALKHIQEPPPPPSQFLPGMHREIESIILKCLEKDPAQRFPDGISFIKALENYRDNTLRTGALPAGMPGRTVADQPAAEETPGGTIVVPADQLTPGAGLVPTGALHAAADDASGGTVVVPSEARPKPQPITREMAAQTPTNVSQSMADITAAEHLKQKQSTPETTVPKPERKIPPADAAQSAQPPARGRKGVKVAILALVLIAGGAGAFYLKGLLSGPNGGNGIKPTPTTTTTKEPSPTTPPRTTPPPTPPKTKPPRTTPPPPAQPLTYGDLPEPDRAEIDDAINNLMGKNNWADTATVVQGLETKYPKNNDIKAMKAALEAHNIMKSIGMTIGDKKKFAQAKANIIPLYVKAITFDRLWFTYQEYAGLLIYHVDDADEYEKNSGKNRYEEALRLIEHAEKTVPQTKDFEEEIKQIQSLKVSIQAKLK